MRHVRSRGREGFGAFASLGQPAAHIRSTHRQPVVDCVLPTTGPLEGGRWVVSVRAPAPTFPIPTG